jgi:lambda repressor-like predicted transcriptional regulator
MSTGILQFRDRKMNSQILPVRETIVPQERPLQPRMMPTSAQLRAALGLLGWSTADLAKNAGVAWRTAQRALQGEGVPRMHVATLERIRNALEAAGIVFLDPNTAGGVGVRMRRS